MIEWVWVDAPDTAPPFPAATAPRRNRPELVASSSHQDTLSVAHPRTPAGLVLDATQADRFGAAVRAFNKQVNAAIVDPGFIVKVRKKLALDQREAAEIFGGGINAFSRYENGKTKPPLALVKLLKVLDRHPDLLSEVRAA